MKDKEFEVLRRARVRVSDAKRQLELINTEHPFNWNNGIHLPEEMLERHHEEALKWAKDELTKAKAAWEAL